MHPQVRRQSAHAMHEGGTDRGSRRSYRNERTAGPFRFCFKYTYGAVIAYRTGWPVALATPTAFALPIDSLLAPVPRPVPERDRHPLIVDGGAGGREGGAAGGVEGTHGALLAFASNILSDRREREFTTTQTQRRTGTATLVSYDTSRLIHMTLRSVP